MSSPTKEAENPNTSPELASRKRGLPSPEVSPKKTGSKKTARKDRRRVSFAPDAELTLVHHFEKDDFASPQAIEDPFLRQTRPSLGSPGITQDHVVMPPPPGNWQSDEPGDITAAVPSLGQLADDLAGNITTAVAYHGRDMTIGLPGNITAHIPNLSSLVAEDEQNAIVLGRNTGEFNMTGSLNIEDKADVVHDPLRHHTVGSPGPQEVANDQGIVDWSRPAFLPPYMGKTNNNTEPLPSSDHPALVQSPDVTNSSLNTLETRRVSVDARRASVASYCQDPPTVSGRLTEKALVAHTDAGACPQRPSRRLSNVTDNLLDEDEEDLLADSGEEDLKAGHTGGLPLGVEDPTMLDGLGHRIRALSQGTPLQTRSPGRFAPTSTGGRLVRSIGYADSYNPRTAGGNTTRLLHDLSGDVTLVNGAGHSGGGFTGGTTAHLLADAHHAAVGSAINSRVAIAHHMQQQQQQQQTKPTEEELSGMSLGDFERPPELPVGMEQSTPASAAVPHPSSAAPLRYTNQEDFTADLLIPGGPRLQRTPLGGGRAVNFAAPPGSILSAGLSQQIPGSVLTGPQPSGSLRRGLPHIVPGSALAARYSGYAPRLSHGAITPVSMAAAPMTFQDFAKLMDVQFLDNLRRGASINYADLQSNPVPNNLPEALTLLCITTPAVAELENGIATLQHEVGMRRLSAADGEAALGQANPPIFRHVAQSDPEVLESYKARVGLLKKLCRLKAVALLKDVRVQMEESRSGRLKRALAELKANLEFAQMHTSYLDEVATAAEQYSGDAKKRADEMAQQKEKERVGRNELLALRHTVAQAEALNDERRTVLQQSADRAQRIQEQAALAQFEREELAGRVEMLRAEVYRRSEARASANRSNVGLAMSKAAHLDRILGCLGWQVESAKASTGELSLLLQGLFRMRLRVLSAGGFSGLIEGLDSTDINALRGIPEDRRRFAASLVRGPITPSGVGASLTVAAIQAAARRASRVADLVVNELDGLRLAFATLSEVSAADACLTVSFVNLDAGVKFKAALQLTPKYPFGPITHETTVTFDGGAQISDVMIASAIAAAPQGPGRVRAICKALHTLARSALPREQQGAGFKFGVENPLFGSHIPAQA